MHAVDMAIDTENQCAVYPSICYKDTGSLHAYDGHVHMIIEVKECHKIVSVSA